MGALTLAAAHGHDAIVQLLLKRRTGVALPDGYLEVALWAALGDSSHEPHPHRHPPGKSSYINIVNMLISEGADVNRPGGLYGNALQTTIAGRNYGLVNILFENGADINAKGGFNGNVLQALASWGAVQKHSRRRSSRESPEFQHCSRHH